MKETVNIFPSGLRPVFTSVYSKRGFPFLTTLSSTCPTTGTLLILLPDFPAMIYISLPFNAFLSAILCRTTLITTTTRMITPLIMFCHSELIPTSGRAFAIVARIMEPRNAPTTVPRPPLMLTPPITQVQHRFPVSMQRISTFLYM